MTGFVVGAQGEPFEIVIERGKVREFSAAVRRDDVDLADHLSTPVTFLMVAEHWMTEENAPWDADALNFERLLHGAQEFVFHAAPPAIGDRLWGRCRIDEVYEKAGSRGGSMTFIEVVTDYRDQSSGDLVAQVRMTMIETGQAVQP